MADYFDKPIYYCPHCKRPIKKSEELLFISRNYQDGRMEMLKHSAKYGKCPFADCNKDIDMLKLIEGKYNHPALPGFYFRRNAGTVYLVCGLVMLFLLKYIFNWGFIPAFFVGLLIGIMAGEIMVFVLDKMSLALR